jgi:hypothetical protein
MCKTLYVEYVERRSSVSSLDFAVVRDPLNRGLLGARWTGGGPAPASENGMRRIWWSASGLLRVEVERNGTLVRMGGRNGSEWWTWDVRTGFTWGDEARRGEIPGPPVSLPAPRALPWIDDRADAQLSFRSLPGKRFRVGREVARVRVRNTESAGGVRCLEWELELDAQYQTVLRRAQFDGGHLTALTVAVNVTYDLPIEAEAFAPARDIADYSLWSRRQRSCS